MSNTGNEANQQTTDEDTQGGSVRIEDYIVSKDGNTMSCDGPLAKAYSEALSELYKKEIDPVTGLALETQANDALAAEKEILAADEVKIGINAGEADENLSLLYGVQKGFTTPEHVIEVTDHFSRMSDEAKSRSVVIIDVSTVDKSGNTRISTKGVDLCEQALESLCIKHNVPVMKSLAQYIKLTS